MVLLNIFNEGFTKKYTGETDLTEAKMSKAEQILKKKIIYKLKQLGRQDLADGIEASNVNLTANSNVKGYYNDANNSFIFNRDLSLKEIVDDLVRSAPNTKPKEKETTEKDTSLTEADNPEIDTEFTDKNISLDIKPVTSWSSGERRSYLQDLQKFD